MSRVALLVFLLARCLAQDQLEMPGIRGKVTGTAGHPASNATVSLRKAGATDIVFSTAAQDGSYSFHSLAAGAEYELKADLGPLSSPVRTFRMDGPREMAGIDLEVSARIRFEEIAQRAGIDFTLRNGATGLFYQPEIMLGGIAAFDFNNDGCMDIFATNGAELPSQIKSGDEFKNRLYRNNCDMTFTDVTDQARLAGAGYAMGVATGDFDNDGNADLFLCGLTNNTLYRNRGDGTFEDITARAGLNRPDPHYGRMWSVSAGWFDYDNDGFLDLFVTHYVAWEAAADRTCKVGGKPYYCHPRDYKGLPNQLFHNNRDGTFTDVSQSSGIAGSIGKGMGVAFGDFNADGLPDVFVTNDSVPNFLFQNLGGGKFQEVGLATGVAYNAQGNAVAGMGADFRDIDDDGRDDIALDAMYWDGFSLYRNHGLPGYFTDETVSTGLALATRNLTGWGMGVFDFDNDGHKDLFFAASHFPGSEAQVQSDSALANHVLRSLGSGRFEDVSGEAGKDFQRRGLFHGAAFADFDNDGRVDAVVTSINGPARLFRNISPQTGHWIALRLTGTKSNRDGLGTKIRLTLPNGAYEYNHATTSVGYASSSERLVRFGLGPYGVTAAIEIHWPSGRVQTLNNVTADQVMNVREQ